MLRKLNYGAAREGTKRENNNKKVTNYQAERTVGANERERKGKAQEGDKSVERAEQAERAERASLATTGSERGKHRKRGTIIEFSPLFSTHHPPPLTMLCLEMDGLQTESNRSNCCGS